MNGQRSRGGGGNMIVYSMFSMLCKGAHVVIGGLHKKPLHVENVLPDIGESSEH